MKFTKLFFSVLAGAAMVACTSDDVLENVTPNDPTLGNDKAYVAIRLVNADAATRGEDGGFANGTADESYVKTAEFYFFNADGSAAQYVSKALSWQPSTGNVEEFANATVVLQGLENKTAPTHVVAVLNGTPEAYKGLTLAAMQEQLLTSTTTSNGFVMTNSSYNDTKNAVKNYWATKLEAKNFLLEEPKQYLDIKDNAVTIYVERLAAKVTLSVEESYTLANLEVEDATGAQTAGVTFKVLGWNISGTAKDSYLQKHIDGAWSLDWTWDVADNLFRSYWAESTNYGKGTYPVSYGSTVDAETKQSSIENATLTYLSWKELTNGLSLPDYCLENTNTVDVLKGNFNSTVTHVLLKAQIRKEGNPLTLVRYDGQLFTADAFMARVLNQINLKGKAYKVTTDDQGTHYDGLAVTDLALVHKYDGHVSVALTADAAAATWSSTKETTTAMNVSVITDMLKLINVDAEYYNDGMMYYNIPIKHLRGGNFTIDSYGVKKVEEGDYGVVRNHWYNITVNNIGNLGNAVYFADENIVPSDKTPTFYVGATINVLAWKVVNQSVDL